VKHKQVKVRQSKVQARSTSKARQGKSNSKHQVVQSKTRQGKSNLKNQVVQSKTRQSKKQLSDWRIYMNKDCINSSQVPIS